MVVYGKEAVSKPWTLEVERPSDIEFVALSNTDFGFKHWLGEIVCIVKCTLLKLLSARLRAAEEHLVKYRIEINDPMNGQGMFAVIRGATLRKSHRHEFNDLPDAIEVHWPA